MIVEIYSDVVCPWCYIGKRKLEAALADYEGRDDLQIIWRPFQLDPGAPATPTPVIDAYARKFGGPDQAVRIIDRMTRVAAEVGLDFHLENAKRANTFLAHRLLGWALQHHGHEAQGRLKERLLKAYFTDALDVSDRGVLARLAGEVGLPEDDAAVFLESDEGAAELRAELEHAWREGITAVPTFVFGERWTVPGAQEPETFLRVLERVQPMLDAERVCTDDVCEI
ncbi:MAG TPA: DsbA family oxidoreductase [Acidimicrobiales bacterium]